MAIQMLSTLVQVMACCLIAPSIYLYQSMTCQLEPHELTPQNFSFNTLRPRQYGCHFADGIFKCILLNKISLKFAPKGPIIIIPTLVQIMAWCRPSDKPLSEPMTVNLLTHICVPRPQWVMKKYLKILSTKWQLFFLSINMLISLFSSVILLGFLLLRCSFRSLLIWF